MRGAHSPLQACASNRSAALPFGNVACDCRRLWESLLPGYHELVPGWARRFGMATTDILNLGASTFWSDLGKIALSYALTLPIGWQREKEEHTAGVRTRSEEHTS